MNTTTINFNEDYEQNNAEERRLSLPKIKRIDNKSFLNTTTINDFAYNN
jgi:hypothetical protein